MGQIDVSHLSFLPPSEAPSLQENRDDNWRHFDKSVNAISFGFVATAILISMFLLMAVFERFLMTKSQLPVGGGSGGRSLAGDVESQMGFNAKQGYSSPKVPEDAKEVSVLMPGEDIPTFIAQPTPIVEHTHCLVKQDILCPKVIRNSYF
ncbi:hypothetical protein L1987_03430 [Smallanthus sonchifolius]|uniref:Uncharacterized protein n=1 Tax=Smallanthus sonchifolius TaxID=185202 RepID=A0ACB9KAV0_9ASTR|nr:hypothetical protein L1987_03430 [Smallanthus sonchifolius]